VSTNVLARLLNVPALLRHLREHRADKSVWDPADDLELTLYGEMFGNNFLHYGYFHDPARDPKTIAFADLLQAMDDYASLLVQRVRPGECVLDVGCGMGGLLAKLDAAGAKPTGVTPNLAHAAHIRKTWPHIPLLQSTLEGLTLAQAPAASFDAVINSESFQYIDLDTGMRKLRELLAPGGRWINIDYFRLVPSAKNTSGHMLADFEQAIARHGFTVRERLDVTENVLPALSFAHLLATRIALPMARFGTQKFFLKRPFWGYLFADTARQKIDGIKLHTIDPDVFRRDKRYILFVLE
jgi:cyclopropane fatty-acyl-phospholipid synthase-like methyltransferase